MVLRCFTQLTLALRLAATVINGGCSDDTCSDFRSTLVARGRKDMTTTVHTKNTTRGTG
ncbi:MAG: DUF4240 domain-containing protein [Chromatiaceae bacterium]|nr:DUF4240 domain-containing protein [Chromatiaceae bacterium]